MYSSGGREDGVPRVGRMYIYPGVYSTHHGRGGIYTPREAIYTHPGRLLTTVIPTIGG